MLQLNMPSTRFQHWIQFCLTIVWKICDPTLMLRRTNYIAHSQYAIFGTCQLKKKHNVSQKLDHDERSTGRSCTPRSKSRSRRLLFFFFFSSLPR